MSDQLRASLSEMVNSPGFLAKYPGYAAVLAQLLPVEDRRVDVMAVSHHRGRFFLHVNVDFFLGNGLKNFRYLPGVLLHEVHHVVLGHLTDSRFRNDSVRFPELMELAMEISANEYVREELPGAPPRWSDFQHFGIGAGQSTMERYRLLAGARQDGRKVPLPPPVDTHTPLGVGRRGNGVRDQGPVGDLTGLMRRALKELTRATAGELTELRVAGQSVRQLLAEYGGDLAGTATADFAEALDDPAAPPLRPLDWRVALRQFTSTLRTAGLSYLRPSRRFPALVGQVPGRSRFALRDKPRLLAAVDTSGSMTREALSEVARQLVPLGRLARITVAECDAEIRRVYPFPGRIDAVVGRGGTDFRPVFAPEFLREHRPDGVVWFTDGCGPAPDEEPAVATLWVLTGRFVRSPCPWGRKVFMGPG